MSDELQMLSVSGCIALSGCEKVAEFLDGYINLLGAVCPTLFETVYLARFLVVLDVLVDAFGA